MRIRDIEVIRLDIPSPRNRSSLGVFDRYDYGVVQVLTDEEVVGLGEIATLWDGGAGVQQHFITEHFRPLLIGEDPTAISRCLHKMNTLIEAAWPARAAVEMALYDIKGKLLGVPVYQLLGGRMRESITLSRSIYMDTPEKMAKNAAAAVEAGYSCVKVKLGLDKHEDEIRVSAVRRAVGDDVLLRVDANMGWRTPKEAIRNIKLLQPHALHSVEQPLPRSDFDGLRSVRTAVDVPIMLDESIWGPDDAWRALQEGVADMLNVYVSESGGLTNASLIMRMAALSGVSCVIGAMPELGIGTAAAVHLGVSAPNLSDPCDACGVSYHEVDVINEELHIRDGTIRPLEGPGLGVSLNIAAVERFRRS